MLRNDRNGAGAKEAGSLLGLRELEIFLAFAQSEHMGRAAQELGITVPSVQRTVRTLELDLGIPLVERDGRRLRLLHAGQVLAEHATGIMRSRIDAAEAARAASGRKRARLRLGHGPSLGFLVVPRYIAKLLRKVPETHVQLRQGTTDVLLALLLAGEIDAAIVSGSPNNPELRVVHLFDEPVLLALPANDPLGHADLVDISAFRERGFITLSAGSANNKALMNMCARAGFRPRIVLEVDDMCTLEGAVAAGLGVAIVPRTMSAHPQPNVARVPIAGTLSEQRAVTLAYPRKAPQNDALAALLSLIAPRHRQSG
jgi:DNA-binding transcriptional LysR family regulator